MICPCSPRDWGVQRILCGVGLLLLVHLLAFLCSQCFFYGAYFNFFSGGPYLPAGHFVRVPVLFSLISSHFLPLGELRPPWPRVALRPSPISRCHLPLSLIILLQFGGLPFLLFQPRFHQVHNDLCMSSSRMAQTALFCVSVVVCSELRKS